MNDLLKKLAGKDRYDYEFAASEIINIGNIALFSELIENDGFLFDFVKRNISERLKNAVNEGNYLNLLKFLKFLKQSGKLSTKVQGVVHRSTGFEPG